MNGDPSQQSFTRKLSVASLSLGPKLERSPSDNKLFTTSERFKDIPANNYKQSL